MRLKVKVKARAKQNRVEKTDDGYKVWVKAVPEQGKANQAVIEVLSEHLKVPKSKISILSGHTASNKVLQIL